MRGRASPFCGEPSPPRGPEPPLAAARPLCIAAIGKGKAEIVAAFLSKNTRDLPVTNALAAADDAWVFLDPDAASQIGK